MAVSSSGEGIVLGTANGTYEIKEKAVQVTWTEVNNREGGTTIWEVGNSDHLTYTHENDVLHIRAMDGSEMEWLDKTLVQE